MEYIHIVFLDNINDEKKKKLKRENLFQRLDKAKVGDISGSDLNAVGQRYSCLSLL